MQVYQGEGQCNKHMSEDSADPPGETASPISSEGGMPELHTISAAASENKDEHEGPSHEEPHSGKVGRIYLCHTIPHNNLAIMSLISQEHLKALPGLLNRFVPPSRMRHLHGKQMNPLSFSLYFHLVMVSKSLILISFIHK